MTRRHTHPVGCGSRPARHNDKDYDMRPYHSASSAKMSCDRAWAHRYIDGIREPDIPWAEIEAGRKVTSRQRSLALGKAVHAVGEAYYREQPVDWASLPGEIYASGIGLLPGIGEYTSVEIEAPIGDIRLVGMPPGAPTMSREICGVRWAGFRDVLFQGATRLQADYKTTSSIRKWALDSDGLANDLQCALYSYDLLLRFGAGRVHSAWIYLETKRVRRSHRVDVELTPEQCIEVIAPFADVCRRRDQIERSADAEQNLGACREYGGCPFHVSQGGPCDARMTAQAYFQTEAIMASSKLGEKFKQFKATIDPPKAPAQGGHSLPSAAPEPPPVTDPAPASDAADTDPAPPPQAAETVPAGKAKAKPKAKPAPPAPDSVAARIDEANQALAEAEAILSQAKQDRSAALEALAKILEDAGE